MAAPVAVLVETRQLPPHPLALGLALTVEVWRGDGWYGYRAKATDETRGEVTVDADSGTCSFDSIEAAASRVTCLHRRLDSR